MFKNTISFVVVLLVVAAAFPVMGQDDLGVDEMGAMGGGGPYIGWLSLSLADLNAVLEQYDYAAFPEGMLVFGGNGFGGMFEGVRFGGGGAGGDVSTRKADKVAKLEIGYGGFAVSWGLAHGDRYDVAVGAVIGGGEARLDLVANRPNSFEEALDTPSNTLLTRGFFMVQPQASVGLSLLPWLAVRVTGGYLFTLPESWKQGETDLPGPPASFSGWEIHVQFEFGGKDTKVDYHIE